MQKKKILFILALLLTAVTQGAWADDRWDVWDGSTETRPTMDPSTGFYPINTAAELAYVRKNWNLVDYKDTSGEKPWRGKVYLLNVNLDLTAVSWTPFGRDGEEDPMGFEGSFYGQDHTIRIKIEDTSTNYQGLFTVIVREGNVYDLHVDAKIDVGNSRLVGGIAGENYGYIQNCWVSGDIKSSHYSAYDADLGGIVGLNSSNGIIKYCCVTANVTNTGKNSGVGGIAGSNNGTIEHVTFYGTRTVEHSQSNLWVGDQGGKLNNYYSEFSQDEYAAASKAVAGYKKDFTSFYRYAIKYTYAINVTNVGEGSIVSDVERAYPGQTITLTKTSGTLASVTGNGTISGNETDGFTFTMPSCDANVWALFVFEDGSIPMTYGTNRLEDGKTYRVVDNLSILERIEVNGTARLILGEGATLYATRGIEVSEYPQHANLTIDGPGTLQIDDCESEKSGIGANAVGTLTINGGTINVTGGHDGGAGIGGDLNNTIGGTITINGGVINATGGGLGHRCGAGIGGGYGSRRTEGVCGDITINGGQVTAIGGDGLYDLGGAAGIGPGQTFMDHGETNSGTLTLSWTNPDDFVYCSSYKNNKRWSVKSITFKKEFVLYGTNTIAKFPNIIYENIYDEIKKIVPNFTLSGTGTEGDPYTIGRADDWNAFANYVNNGGMSFEGQFVKLTSDISVSTMAGEDDGISFKGTFDGDSHKLTFNNGTALDPFNEDYCAPFRHVKNATIKNLHVDGSIYTSVQKAAGFVGESHGALTITNCRSSVAITGSKSGDGTFGGFVATLSGADNTITIDGCVFDGSFATTNGTTNCAGFVGWPVYNKPTIKNSLMMPSSVDAGMLNNTFARWHSTYEPTITNCYYVSTANLPSNQGTKVAVSATAPANLGDLVQDYGMVKAYQIGILFDGKYYVGPASISLADNADNTTTISNVDGYVADVTLADRTLYKDGKWNTLCLPFDVVLEGSALKGATARPFTAASISGTTMNLTFGDAVTTLTAGTPYIIKWASGVNIENPMFYGVTIDKTDRSYDNGQSGDIRVRFLGTYKSTAFDATDNSILLMGGNNTLYYPTTGAGIGAQRAYFKIGDGTALARLTNFNIDFGDGETTTGIISIENGQLTIDNSAGGWYSLDGRRLDSKPTKKGVYINNGKKTVIK